MEYLPGEHSSGPRDPSPEHRGWVVFVAGQIVRCPNCDKGLGEVRGGIQIQVRRTRQDPSACGLLHRCRSCRDYLEIRQVNADHEQAA
jgi:hypothetical protein